MTPVEIFERSFPGREVRAEGLTVISWVLPHTRLTKNDNRKETTLPSERWARAKTLWRRIPGTADDTRDGHARKSRSPFRCSFTCSVPDSQCLRTLWSCIKLVRAPRGVRLGAGDIRALRRPDHAGREGYEMRFGDCTDRDLPDTSALHRSSCMVPVLCKRHLRALHRALPGGGALGKRA